jgi:predicted dehydrogenase
MDEASLPMARPLAANLGELGTTPTVCGPGDRAVSQLAEAQSWPYASLKDLLDEPDIGLLVLCTHRGLKPEVLQQIRQAQIPIACVGPLGDDIEQVTKWAGQASALPISTLGRFTDTAGFSQAAQPEQHLERPRLIRFGSAGQPDNLSLLQRLIDAWQTVLRFSPSPEAVDASIFPAPQDSDLPHQGQLAAHARLPGGGAITLDLTSQAPADRRSLDIVAQAGQLHVTDTHHEMFAEDGTLLDQSPSPRQPAGFIASVADQITAAFSRGIEPPAPPSADVLACAQACLLSARTRQPEYVEKLRKLYD